MKHLLSNLHRLAPGAILVALSGCGIYVPHVPAAPIIERGQVEVKVAVAPLMSFTTALTKPRSGRWVPATEGYVAFSPVPHVFGLVAGGGNFVGALRRNAREYYNERQGDVGLGYYNRFGVPGSQWYLAALVGIGRGEYAEAVKRTSDVYFSFYAVKTKRPDRLTARFQRQFAQVYAARGIGQRVTFSYYVRLARLSYAVAEDHSNYQGATGQTQAAPIKRTVFYLEPGWSLRFGRGALQGVVEAFWSSPLRGREAKKDNYLLASNNTSLLTFGVIYRPYLFGRPAAKLVE